MKVSFITEIQDESIKNHIHWRKPMRKRICVSIFMRADTTIRSSLELANWPRETLTLNGDTAITDAHEVEGFLANLKERKAA